MAFHKWNSCYWHFGFHKIFWSIIYLLRKNSCISRRWSSLVLSPHSYIIIEIKGSSNKNSQSNLPCDLKPTSQTIFITLLVRNALFMCKSQNVSAGENRPAAWRVFPNTSRSLGPSCSGAALLRSPDGPMRAGIRRPRKNRQALRSKAGSSVYRLRV